MLATYTKEEEEEEEEGSFKVAPEPRAYQTLNKPIAEFASVNEPGGKMVWYPREMKRTNVSGVYHHQLVGDWGRTTGKRSKTQEKRKFTEEESS
jgi:hypothetical protein